jgi:3(or 17)beta-hydroxysteroid dehydrogenase
MGRLDGKVCHRHRRSGRLGEAEATVLAREGASMILTDVSSEGGATAGEIGGDALFVRHDGRDEDAWRAVVATAVRRARTRRTRHRP